MKIKEVYVFRIPEGRDLMEFIKEFAERNEIHCASVNIIGALKNAEIGYFSEEEGRYLKKEINEQCELLSAMGNISRKIEEVFPHIHVILGKKDFTVVGGHLIRGEVFVAEVIIHEYDGRCQREKYGDLYLWEPED
ncbi:MAG: DNA-binding protein [Euryarchaeota archaeon]|nr:DNA-binding protein [Euryarchaeota archaeon]